jgi:hypothetical protein
VAAAEDRAETVIDWRKAVEERAAARDRQRRYGIGRP